MGIFSSIKNAIWGEDEETETKTATPAPAPAATIAGSAATGRAPIREVDVVERVSNIPGADKLNWKTSIVDLLKLLNLDSSYGHRKELAAEVGIDDYSGSAEDNIALHRAVMQKLADAGGIVPDDLKD
ncbi:MAG: DUF3597 domain-containing protein [Pseudomonadota bacterium]